LHHQIPNELASVRSPNVNSGTIDRAYKGERYEKFSEGCVGGHLQKARVVRRRRGR